ncbi:MutS protein msh4 [Gnomoniopsis sp. IMI 355080]|nr:MutS protein msh4 [Gnomoniopsis sp. IMI 355080]
MAPATPGPSRLVAVPESMSISRSSVPYSSYFSRRSDRSTPSADSIQSRARHASQTSSRRESLASGTTPAYSNASTPSGRRSRAASSIGGGEASHIICAVSEARGIAPSVGIAFVNVSTGEAVLSQICDNQSYVKTIHKVTVFEPSQILIVSTACPPNPKSCLCSTIEEELPGVPVVPLNRKYWSETAGLEFLQALAFKEDIEAIKVAIEGNFYATCSFSAAMKYLELEFSLRIANHSLRIRYQPSEESMMISLPTIQALELVQNLQNPSSKASLFGLLNRTLTRMGARKLRSNILQPSTQAELVLKPRYAALEELCTKEDMFFEVRTALKSFGDVEKLLTKLIVLPTQPSLEASEQAINDVLMVKNFVVSVPAVFKSLAAARCDLLDKIRNHCRPEITTRILDRIAAVINDDVAWVNKPLDLRNQRVYAVRSGIHGLLDVARTTYKEATDDMHQHVGELNAGLGLAAELKFENRRRYWLRFRVLDFENGLIPGALINCVRKKEFLECQTLQMVKLNQRMTDSVDEVIMQSDKVVQQLLDTIRMEIPNLFKVCESIALLDMLASFGQAVTTREYVKPELRETLALKSARHPLLDMSLDKFIPNDYYASGQYAFQIVTGCNMSGKSTYIRAVALLQVMVQIGCFVPAEYASFKIIHNLFSRTSTDDRIESNMSTFSVEMREMAFILHNIDDKSLAIIDELGRGTSTRDGLAIAIATAEALVQSRALVLFATHFTELAQVLEDRPGVLNLHLSTETTVAEDGIPRMTMLYKIDSGTVQDENYGIKLARAIGFPWRFLNVAEDVSNALKQASEANRQNSESRKVAKRRKLVLNLHETLKQAYDSEMDDETLRRYLQRLQSEFISRMEAIEGDGGRDNALAKTVIEIESDVTAETDMEESEDEPMSSSPGA